MKRRQSEISGKSWPFIWRSSIRERREKKAFLCFLLPSLIGTAFFTVIPFGDVVRRSFMTEVTGQFTGFSHYKTIFANQAFLLAVKNTLRFTLTGIPLLLICGFLIALLFSGSGKAQILKPLYLLPYTLPAAVVVIVWKVIGYYLTGQEFLVLLLCYLWKNTGYTVILWLAGIKGIQKEILEAAMVDGAGSFQRVRYIILPGLKNVFFTIVILSFLNSFKIYREAYLTAGAYPDRSIYLLQHLFNNWFVNLEFSKMAAASVLLFLVLLSGIWLLQGRWKEKEE